MMSRNEIVVTFQALRTRSSSGEHVSVLLNHHSTLPTFLYFGKDKTLHPAIFAYFTWSPLDGDRGGIVFIGVES
jgi:hypothetical protein